MRKLFWLAPIVAPFFIVTACDMSSDALLGRGAHASHRIDYRKLADNGFDRCEHPTPFMRSSVSADDERCVNPQGALVSSASYRHDGRLIYEVTVKRLPQRGDVYPEIAEITAKDWPEAHRFTFTCETARTDASQGVRVYRCTSNEEPSTLPMSPTSITLVNAACANRSEVVYVDPFESDSALGWDCES